MKVLDVNESDINYCHDCLNKESAIEFISNGYTYVGINYSAFDYCIYNTKLYKDTVYILDEIVID